jgi:4-hydroxy-tetrahydrodipicolinate synthase
MKLSGVIGYLVTPFVDGFINEPVLRLMVNRLIASGVHGLSPLGSTGESAYLNDEEWEVVARVTVEECRGRVPVVIGASALTTRKAVNLAQKAKALGADAVMVAPLSYWKLREQEVFGHYAAISEAVDLPIMVYNNPATCGIDLSPELLVKLIRQLEHPFAIKESSGDIQRMHRIQELSGGEIPFFNGCNPLALEALCAGASGWCTAAPNLIARDNLMLWDCVQQGDLKAARDVFYRQLPLLRFILKGGLPATVKSGLSLQGIDAGVPRLPLLPLDPDGTQALAALLASVSPFEEA